MKSIKSEKMIVKKKYTLPKLMEHVRTGKVVLFVNSSTGMVVQVGNESDDHLGHYMDGWIAYNDPHEWRVFDGSVILQND